MRPYRPHHLLLMATLLLPLLAPAAAERDDRIVRHAAALAAYEAGQFSRAYPAFVALAEQGYRPAARLALLMASRGRALYGQVFAASLPQREHWAAMQVPPLPADAFAADRPAAR